VKLIPYRRAELSGCRNAAVPSAGGGADTVVSFGRGTDIGGSGVGQSRRHCAPIQLAQCRFHRLAISNAKIIIF